MKLLTKRLLSAFMALVMVLCLLPAAALADESTTTLDSVWKDRSPHTQLYVLTTKPGQSYPVYGAKYEPNGGVLYGRTDLGGFLPDGSYGNLNTQEASNESIIGHYYGTNSFSATPLSKFEYNFNPVLADGQHTFLLYLNFDNEGADCPRVVAGEYDASLQQLFQYLNTFTCPVFVRIGGECNVWTTATTPQDFISAYQHIAQIARAAAPNVALVFSPNFSSAHRVDMDTFYPGDQYVDWVGVSLYYNPSAGQGEKQDEFLGRGEIFADPMLNIQQVVNLAGLHNKPVIVTEGGTANKLNGQDYTDFAAVRMQKAMAFLPMVYPRVKAIVNSDYNPSAPDTTLLNLTFYDNPTITSAVRNAVSGAGNYRSDYNGAGLYLTPLSDSPNLADTPDGDIHFTAYTYSPTKLTATFTVDGQTVGTSSDYPYTCDVSRSVLASGTHTVAVSFSNGQSVSYTVAGAGGSGTPSTPSDPSSDTPSKWAEEEVGKAVSLGLVPESLQSKYTANINRGEFAALAVTLYETVTGKEITDRKTFPDTSDENAQKLGSLGVVQGDQYGNYNPAGIIDRQQAAVFLARLAEVAGKPMTAKPLTFADSSTIKDWAAKEVSLAYGSGVMEGDGNNFNPTQQYTREQSILTMYRLYTYFNG